MAWQEVPWVEQFDRDGEMASAAMPQHRLILHFITFIPEGAIGVASQAGIATA